MKFSRIVLYTSLFISFLCSMNVWFAWNDNKRYIDFGLALIIFFIVFVGRIKLDTSARNIKAFLLLSIAYFGYGFSYNNIKSILILAGALFTFFVIVCLNQKDRKKCLSFITTCYTCMLIPSLILWVFNKFHQLPYYNIVQIDNEVLNYWPYYNHIIFLQAQSLGYMYRFSGPFLEPGHLGMMTAFIVYANRFNLKDWRVISLCVIVLFSMSLAGYCLMAIAYCFNKLIFNKQFVKRVLVSALAAGLGYYIVINYNRGYNMINELILARMEYDEDKGFSGNNRVFGDIDYYYGRLLKSPTLFWTGYSKETMKQLAEAGSRGTGFVMFVVTNGFFGLILVSLFYIYYARTSKCKRNALLFLLFVCAAFWQRCYPFWTSWLICYAWGLSIYDELNYVPSQNKKRLAHKREISEDEQSAIPVTE